MRIQLQLIVMALANLANLILFPVYAAQHITPPIQTEVLYVTENQTFDMPIDYSTSAPQGNNEVGLGLRVHFDSSVLTFNDITQALQNNIQPIGNVQDDTNDYDGDSHTDKFFVIAWVDITGNWPSDSNVFPLRLFTSNFSTTANFTGSTRVTFTASSTSGDAEFTTAPQIICRKPVVSLSANTSNLAEGEQTNLTVNLGQALPEDCGALTVTVNTTGTATAGTDYQDFNHSVVFLPNETSASLAINTLNDNSAEGNETLILALQNNENYALSQNSTQTLTIEDKTDKCIDIDGNGAVDVLTDGITLTRYLLGYRGAALIEQSIAANATRTAPASIQSYIENHAQTGCYDIDGNGSLDALTDGVLLIRYLSDYQDDNLIQGAIGQNAARTTTNGISSYIASLLAP